MSSKGRWWDGKKKCLNLAVDGVGAIVHLGSYRNTLCLAPDRNTCSAMILAHDVRLITLH